MSFSQKTFTGELFVGISGNQIDGDGRGGYNKAGLIFGANTNIYFSEKKSANIALYYIGKGAASYVQYADGVKVQDYRASYHYIELPITYEYRIIPKFAIAGGLAPAYLIRARHYFWGSEDPSDYGLSNFDLSYTIQPKFYWTKHIALNVQFTRSILTIKKRDYVVNNNLSLILQYTF